MARRGLYVDAHDVESLYGNLSKAPMKILQAMQNNKRARPRGRPRKQIESETKMNEEQKS
jgi:hypothetical protein